MCSGLSIGEVFLIPIHGSYLGDYNKGGGATGEHSHCLNVWQHFSRVSGAGEVTEFDDGDG